MDPIGTREVFGVIRSLAEHGMTVVMAEHKMEWVAQFADRVVALYEGKVLMEGKPRDVLTSDRTDRSRIRYFTLHIHCARGGKTRPLAKGHGAAGHLG